MKLILEGFSNAEIANKLLITEKTVKFHLTNIYAKTGVQSRAQVIVKFLRSSEGENEYFKLMRELINGKGA